MIKTGGRSERGGGQWERRKRKRLCEALIIKTNLPGTVCLPVVMKCTCVHWYNISVLTSIHFLHSSRPVTSSVHIDSERHCCAGHWWHKCRPPSELHVSLQPLFRGKLLAISLLCQVSSRCVCQRLSSYTTWHPAVKATSTSKTSPDSPSAATLYNCIY